MSDSDFITVYSAASSGYRYWWIPTAGLIFILIGLILPMLLNSGIFPVYQKRIFNGWFPALWTVFSFFWTIMAFIVTFDAYWSAREALLFGKTQYVEGVVSNYVSYVPHHNDESFAVSGVPFHYSDYVVGGGFNQTAFNGGPIHEGLYVRIWYSGNDILKLQVAKKS